MRVGTDTVCFGEGFLFFSLGVTGWGMFIVLGFTGGVQYCVGAAGFLLLCL